MMRLRVGVVSLLLVLSANVRADDGAASIAAGGIVVMKRETRIVMAKEVLQISSKKVVVDYDFRNDGDEDVTTTVAFPIPDYDWYFDREGSEKGFDNFKLWVDQSPAQYQIEARAFLKDKEYTDLLNSMHVDIAGFGHGSLFREVNGREQLVALSQDLERLTEDQLATLRKAGLIDTDPNNKQPLWHVKKKYYWQQTFPAHKTVHIRHEYAPVLGANNGFRYAMGPSPDKLTTSDLESMCVDDQLYSKLKSTPADQDGGYLYVDFILTTANTWKTPIEDFTLIVERPRSKTNRGEPETNYVSFCWDGPVTKIDADHFSAHTTNLVPSRELRIGFLQIRPPRQ